MFFFIVKAQIFLSLGLKGIPFWYSQITWTLKVIKKYTSVNKSGKYPGLTSLEGKIFNFSLKSTQCLCHYPLYTSSVVPRILHLLLPSLSTPDHRIALVHCKLSRPGLCGRPPAYSFSRSSASGCVQIRDYSQL